MKKNGAVFVEILIAVLWLSFGLLFCISMIRHSTIQGEMLRKQWLVNREILNIQSSVCLAGPEVRAWLYANPAKIVNRSSEQVQYDDTIIQSRSVETDGQKKIFISGAFLMGDTSYPCMEIPIYVE